MPATALGPAPVNFLYTNIGRGHPYYLDGIVECLSPDRVGGVTDVFEATSGLSRRGWKLARSIYEGGGRGRSHSLLYNWLRGRSDFNRPGLAQEVMGRPLRRIYLDDPAPLVVAHPVLAAILKDKPNLFYQHGEIAAPRESWVRGKHRVFVPISQTAITLLAAGAATENIFVSGLCIEPALVSQADGAFDARLQRLAGSDPLCGAFFSSGAEPRQHVDSLVAAATSVLTAGGRALIFAKRSGALAARASARLAREDQDFEAVRSPEDAPSKMPRALMCVYEDRHELNEFTRKLFASFDFFVAPSHERTNWALGLGLPMFVVDPPLGSFSPLNREFLLDSGVASSLLDLDEAASFGETLTELRRSGELPRMAEAGWRRFDIRGFFNIAELLGSS